MLILQPRGGKVRAVCQMLFYEAALCRPLNLLGTMLSLGGICKGLKGFADCHDGAADRGSGLGEPTSNWYWKRDSPSSSVPLLCGQSEPQLAVRYLGFALPSANTHSLRGLCAAAIRGAVHRVRLTHRIDVSNRCHLMALFLPWT